MLSATGGLSPESAAAQPRYTHDQPVDDYPFDSPRSSSSGRDNPMEGIGEIVGMAVGVGVGLVLLSLAMMMALASLVGYVLARWRVAREGGVQDPQPGSMAGQPAAGDAAARRGPPDPQLGLKTGLWFFRMLACHVALAGTMLFMYALMTKQGDAAQKDVFRLAGGLLVPGVLLYAAHFGMSYLTNARQHPVVTRLFAGANMLFVGLLAFTALVAAFVLAFQKHASTEAHRFAWSAVMVYLPAWIVQFVLVFRRGGIFTGPTPAQMEARIDAAPSVYPPVGTSPPPGP